MQNTKFLVALVASAALALSCAKVSDGKLVATPFAKPYQKKAQQAPRFLTGGIAPLPSCDAAEQFIEDRVVEQMHAALDRQIEAVKSGGWGGWRGGDVVQAPSAPAPASGPMPAPIVAAMPESVTRTNVQVEGVEEADFVKNDDTHLFQIVGKTLHILRTWPADQLAEIATLPLHDYARELFLDEARHRLVILGSGEMGRWDTTYLDVIDVTDPAAPRLLGTKSFAGSLATSRREGSVVRLVTSASTSTPEGIVYDPSDPVFWSLPPDMRGNAVEQLRAPNEALIRAKSKEFWLGETLAASGCAQVFAPSVSAALGLTRVITFDLDADTTDEQVLLARAEHHYASHEALYLSTGYYWWDVAARDGDYTFLHKFATSGAQTVYMGSGGIDGTVLDSFALDEFEGRLRVATTISVPGKDQISRVSVLELKEGALSVVGATPDLAPRERIYATRFNGPMGYVVTFRQVDPLFVLDLSDPASPRVAGELKIPGFSSYIHLMGDGRLLAMGRDADEATGRVRGLKLSLFDVSVPATPREVDAFVLSGDRWATSAAQGDHHAFTYAANQGLLALPFSTYDYGNGQNGQAHGLRVFRIDPDRGISEVGGLDMTDLGAWNAAVGRSIFADDFVYAVSGAGVRSARVPDLEHPLATVLYPQEMPRPIGMCVLENPRR